MSGFTRKLRRDALASLWSITDTRGDHWWKHLLSLWRPNGTAAGRQGLRLAMRDNYLLLSARPVGGACRLRARTAPS
jgi:hypothetical protein